ncbi:MAG: zinc ribbon domain-containing protein [Spiroplasma sp.]|nr:zinc ribbon domain-containing protein [Spiroplasma sp.]
MNEENKEYKKCQSCAMPITKEKNKGTNDDNTLSTKYCFHCYQDGKFTQPHLNCEEMQQISLNFFKKEHPIIAFFVGRSYVKAIPKLARWTDKPNKK